MGLHSFAREPTPILVMLAVPKTIAECEETIALAAFHHDIFSKRSVVRPNYAHFTIGDRTRQCIGKGLALMKVSLVLALLAQRCELHLTFGCRVESAARATVRPRDGLWMWAHPH